MVLFPAGPSGRSGSKAWALVVGLPRLAIVLFCLGLFACEAPGFNPNDPATQDFVLSSALRCTLTQSCQRASGAGSASSQIPASLAANLYAWYPLNGDINDYSGNSRHGTFPGGIWPGTTGPTYTVNRSAVANAAGQFNGTDQYFATNFDPACTQDFSIALWVRGVSLVSRTFMGLQTAPNTNPGIMIHTDAGGQPAFSAFWIAGGANSDLIQAQTPTVIGSNVWTHLTYVHDGATRNGVFYVNGSGATPSAYVGAFPGCTTGTGTNKWWDASPLNIGYGYPNVFFPGQLDDLWFFLDRKLTVANITTLMNQP